MPVGRQKRNTPAFARGLVFAIGILMVRPDSAHSIAVTLFSPGLPQRIGGIWRIMQS